MTNLKKNLIFPIFFLFFLSCGYTPIFSKKDVNFSIENIEFSGDIDVKRNISNALFNYKNKPDKDKKISLVITNLKNTTIGSKNSKGEAETYRIGIDANVKIILLKKTLLKHQYTLLLKVSPKKN